MKHSIKIWTLLLFFFAAVLPSFSQEHFTFKGVPIDGTLSAFSHKLAAKGCKYAYSEGQEFMRGSFAGHDNCMIMIHAHNNNSYVYAVTVILSENKSWSSLERDYNTTKKMLQTKYGYPTEAIESFSSDVSEMGDTYKMYQLEQGGCDYHSFFQNEIGIVRLEINSTGNYEGDVTLSYVDIENFSKHKNAAIDEL